MTEAVPPLVDHIDLDARFVQIEGGKRLPITNCLDDENDNCEPREAVVIIAGNDEFGFLVIDMTAGLFERPLH